MAPPASTFVESPGTLAAHCANGRGRNAQACAGTGASRSSIHASGAEALANWRTFLDAETSGGRFLPWREVAVSTGLSRTTAWRLQKRGDFPSPYAISPGRVGYREAEIEAWRVSRGHSVGRASARGSATPGGPERCATSRDRLASQGPRLDEPMAEGADNREAKAPQVVASVERARAATRRGAAGRRRSQHPKAIAQQMLFDF
ncbi:MAG: hypothetical protein DI570_05050 [Phenylobacterium zucineum]|nr:MAG: hypothetical protein DI570_05050 [Phenylobacterium zucineum]